jgi:hypothetical protein
MTRALYRVALWLHPPAFRRQYAEEMLWIFDEFAAENGEFSLVRDVLVSLLRQWFVRSRLWLVPMALAGALFTVLAGNAALHALFHRLIVRRAESPQELFLFTVALALITVAFTLIAAVLPVLRARRGRGWRRA